MKNVVLSTVVTGLLVFAMPSAASTCSLVNGSFEDDGVINDILIQEPNGWDANFTDPDKFIGYVDTDWVTDANYNLTLYSDSWFVTFEGDEQATVEQEVCLTDVNEIVFDLYLSTVSYPWDGSRISPVLLIDDDVVWDLSGGGSDIGGAYYDERYQVDDIYRGAGVHKLSFGLRITYAGMLADYYFTDWDNIRFTSYCGGLGLVPGDVTRDCYVDANDVRELTGVWLQEVGAGSRYNLYDDDPNGLVNIRDYAVLAGHWLESSYD